ncbi:unnamed protein product [Hydatigera taeniaeformis]|uniref:Uncharacterized protein n=1 Tax=Hydatigena taeniaeformis TaxID=6205 RepID=A0A0R3WK91_HYDTA|nr:unnamed protein product [Hydatigera taeniaeformis]
MSLSQCLDLSNTRDFVHVDEEVIFFSEINKALHVFAFFPDKGCGYSGSFSTLFLREMARKFDFSNIHSLLIWARDRISGKRYSFQDVDSENVRFTMGSVLSHQLSLQLSRSENETDLVVALAKALLRKQARVEELVKANSEFLNQLNIEDPTSSSSKKRRTSGMSFTNPQLRKRKPATGLTFISSTDNAT